MRLPNKLFTFAESTLSDLAPVLSQISPDGTAVTDLQANCTSLRDDPQRFIEALTVLFALNQVQLDEETETIHRVD